MARNSALRGSSIGSGPTGVPARGDLVERVAVTFWCANGHTARPQFAATAPIPHTWDCHACDLSAGRDPDNPPSVLSVEAYKTHLAYLHERCSGAGRCDPPGRGPGETARHRTRPPGGGRR